MSKNGIQIYNFELKQKNQFLIRKNLQRKNPARDKNREEMEAQNQQQQQLLLQQYLQYQSLQQQQAAQLPQLPEDAMLRMNLLMMAQLQAQQELLNKQMMFSRVDQGYYTSSASSGSSPVRDLESPPPAPKKSRKRQKSKDESKSARKQQKSSSQEKQTFLGLYEVYGVIGVGGGGMVYSGRRITDGLPVAIKRVMREKVKRWETVDGHKVPQEIALMLR